MLIKDPGAPAHDCMPPWKQLQSKTKAWRHPDRAAEPLIFNPDSTIQRKTLTEDPVVLNESVQLKVASDVGLASLKINLPPKIAHAIKNINRTRMEESIRMGSRGPCSRLNVMRTESRERIQGKTFLPLIPAGISVLTAEIIAGVPARPQKHVRRTLRRGGKVAGPRGKSALQNSGRKIETINHRSGLIEGIQIGRNRLRIEKIQIGKLHILWSGMEGGRQNMPLRYHIVKLRKQIL